MYASLPEKGLKACRLALLVHRNVAWDSLLTVYASVPCHRSVCLANVLMGAVLLVDSTDCVICHQYHQPFLCVRGKS